MSFRGPKGKIIKRSAVKKKLVTISLVVLDWSVISCSWVYQWILTTTPCFLIAVMLPSICGHGWCSVFALCENGRVDDGYTDDKHLSIVILTCFSMRTHWLDLFLLNSWTHHTHCLWYHMICCSIDGLYGGVAWCIVPWIVAISWQNFCNVTSLVPLVYHWLYCLQKLILYINTYHR